MKNIITALALLISLTFSVEAKNIDPEALDEKIEKVMQLTGAPGISVAISGKDGFTFTKGYGYKNVDEELMVDSETLFPIGSCTKAFTASLIGMLEYEGKLDLNESPRKYIDNLEFNTQEMNRNITIEDLLTHITGLPRYDLSWYLFPTESRDSLIRRVKYMEAVSQPGRKYNYNNFMYLTLGMVIENITGKSWEENVVERIIKPLGMNNTNLDIEQLSNSMNAAVGYNAKKGEKPEVMPYYNIAAMSPAGSINSSASDIIEWMRLWLNNGNHNNEEIIPNQFILEAISQKIPVSSGLPYSSNADIHGGSYGYGWFVHSYRGRYRVEHGGNIDGFSSSISLFPTEDLGISVFVNQQNSKAPSIISKIIADMIFDEKSDSWLSDLEEKNSDSQNKDELEDYEIVEKRIENTVPSHPLDDYSGDYLNEAFGTFYIEHRNDSLFIIYENEAQYLSHYHYDVFQPYDVIDGEISESKRGNNLIKFNSDIDGNISSVECIYEAQVGPTLFTKSRKIINMDLLNLSYYEGEYNFNGINAEFISVGENLKFNVPGQGVFTLIPTDIHNFDIKELNGFSIAFHEENESIVAATFYQPQGNIRIPKADK